MSTRGTPRVQNPRSVPEHFSVLRDPQQASHVSTGTDASSPDNQKGGTPGTQQARLRRTSSLGDKIREVWFLCETIVQVHQFNCVDVLHLMLLHCSR